MDDCIFCKIISGESKSEIITESENFLVIKNIYPNVEGHSLVIPKKHYSNFTELPQRLYEELLATTKIATEKITDGNFNLIINNGHIAGQIIEHLHLHILPRKPDDEFKLGV